MNVSARFLGKLSGQRQYRARLSQWLVPALVGLALTALGAGWAHAGPAVELSATRIDFDPLPDRADESDFNFRSLRGNAVVRWEYRPGSTVFLVWTQSRSSEDPVGDFQFRRDRSALFDARPDNVLLVKVNYWVGL